MMLSHAARSLARSRLVAASTAVRGMASLEQFDEYGKAVFTGAVADEYLKKQGSSGDILKDPTWVKNHADTVAKAVFDWYVKSVEKRVK